MKQLPLLIAVLTILLLGVLGTFLFPSGGNKEKNTTLSFPESAGTVSETENQGTDNRGTTGSQGNSGLSVVRDSSFTYVPGSPSGSASSPTSQTSAQSQNSYVP